MADLFTLSLDYVRVGAYDPGETAVAVRIVDSWHDFVVGDSVASWTAPSASWLRSYVVGTNPYTYSDVFLTATVVDINGVPLDVGDEVTWESDDGSAFAVGEVYATGMWSNATMVPMNDHGSAAIRARFRTLVSNDVVLTYDPWRQRQNMGFWLPGGRRKQIVVGPPVNGGDPGGGRPVWDRRGIGDGDFDVTPSGTLTGFTGTKAGWLQFTMTWGTVTDVVPVTVDETVFLVTLVDGVMVGGLPWFQVTAAWRTTGEADELAERFVGQGLTLTPGTSEVFEYDNGAGSLEVDTETDETTWAAPTAARTPDWD